MNNNIIFNKWFDYYYKIDNQILTDQHIAASLRSLFITLSPIPKFAYILIQFKIKIDDYNVRSISYVQTVRLDQLEDLIDIFIEFWNLRSEDYHIINVDSIIYTYKILDPDKNNNVIKVSKLNRSMRSTIQNNPVFQFKGYNLPLTMDITSWGHIYFDNNYTNAIIIQSNSTYLIKLYDIYSEVELKVNNISVLKFKDIMNNKGDLSTFTRIIENQEYIFINGELIIKKIIKKVDYLKPINKSIYLSHDFITMDLETRIIDNGILEPYCISIYDGKTKISFYLSDYENSELMLEGSINYLMKRKYDQYKVYLHNFSYFDGIFLMKVLSNLSKNIRPIIRDGRLIDIRFSFYYNNSNYTLYFRDSLLLLPSSLRKLAINFNVENKGIFPYKFVNDNILNYEGNVPEYKYFDNITIEEYNDYCHQYINKQWNLKDETIKYCIQDCITLYQIIDKFNHKIFDLFRIDIHKYPTLSSLAFGIYRSNYLKKEYKIPLIHGKIYDFIKQSYTGGSVDVYKPFPKTNEKIKSYDVNSLYPTVMKEYPMPIGNPTYFEGNILKLDSNSFGFFEVKVIAPDNLYIPILQTKLKINNLNKTVAPLGTWTGIYFSEEIKNAMMYGYQFEVLRGYQFDKGYIFKEYVDFLFSLKMNSDKNSADYIICKLLLNSLYGRFGMNPNMEHHVIIDSNETIKIIDKYKVTNIIDFKNGKELASFFYNSNHNKSENLNISIPISSAITAYGRIFMAYFKIRYHQHIYYSDTDSLYLDITLNPKYIGNKLGQFKLEHIFNDVVFMAPKVYGGITIDNKEIIKIKGIKENIIKFEELLSILNFQSKLEIYQKKWFRDMAKGNITIKSEIYTLMITDSKRNLIYDNNKLVETKPLKLINGKIINNESEEK